MLPGRLHDRCTKTGHALHNEGVLIADVYLASTPLAFPRANGQRLAFVLMSGLLDPFTW